MACYSYSSGDPILYNNNVEIVHTASGNNYSFSSISWLCELPVSGQLQVFTRPTPTGVETLKILNTDYTVNTTLNRIEFTSTPTGEVVIRRKTDSEKMLFKFIDGAKLTATQLNASLHQLLFMVQEKEFAGSTFNYFNTGGIQIVGGPNPVVFNLTSLTPGAGLVWNGTQFTAQSFTNTLDSLTNVNITSPANKSILVFNSSNSKWEDQLPTVDITLSNLLFADRTFYNNGGFNSFNTAGSISVSGKSELDGFKNGSGKWVLTDAPTVYHILKKLTPSETDPETFFDSIDTAITGLSANISNPVKVKFYWDLGLERRDIVDNLTSLVLSDMPTAFWDNPNELYSASGYSPTVVGAMKFYGVLDSSGITHLTSPYFYQTLSGAIQQTYISKVRGYGIKSFYLSVPESCCSAFPDLPAVHTSGDYFSFGVGVADNATLVASLTGIGTENENSFVDYYLLALRDMAFAAPRAMPADASTVKNKDGITRRLKGHLISADYNGFENIMFKMLENASDLGSNSLWKIPKQIIYYNKAALAVANKDTAELFINSNFDKNSVRFTGYSELAKTVPVTATNVTATSGKYFKADELWNDWCVKWNTDPVVDSNKRFNEADIDWYIRGLSTTATAANLGLYKTYSWQAPYTWDFTASGGTFISQAVFPYSFRPNDYKFGVGVGTDLNVAGTHYFNIDANCLFSTASNYVPDPVDEYVYRIVTKRSLLGFFSAVGDTHLKSSIILEYGFTDHNFNSRTTALTTKASIFKKGLLRPGVCRSMNLLNKSNVKVYVKNETVETWNGDTRYVITLGIQVPRLKSIGYSRMFRKFAATSANSNYPIFGTNTVDTEIDSGPWNYSGIDYIDTLGITGSWGAGSAFTKFYNPATALSGVISNEDLDLTAAEDLRPHNDMISGRNECAVKFTRLGIPSNLWIRLSVLNTDGSLGILDSSGFTSATNE